MFEFLPEWLKSILACSAVVAIIVSGFVMTSYKGKGTDKSSKSTDNTKVGK